VVLKSTGAVYVGVPLGTISVPLSATLPLSSTINEPFRARFVAPLGTSNVTT
jgi:hypothetical protein